MSESGELRMFLDRMLEEIDRIRTEFAVEQGTSGAAMLQLETVRHKIGKRAREQGRHEPAYPFRDPGRDVRTAVEGMIVEYLRDVLRVFPELRSTSHRDWKIELNLDGGGLWTVAVEEAGGAVRSRIEGRYFRCTEALSAARALIDSLDRESP